MEQKQREATQNQEQIEAQAYEVETGAEQIEIQTPKGIVVKLSSHQEPMQTLHGRALSIIEDLTTNKEGGKPPGVN